MQKTSFFPGIGSLPEQFGALIDLQAQALSELRMLNEDVPVVASGVDPELYDFDVPAAGYTHSSMLKIIAIMVSVDTVGLLTFSVGGAQKLGWYMGANSTVFIALTGVAMTVARGLQLSIAPAGGNYKCHVWAYPS